MTDAITQSLMDELQISEEEATLRLSDWEIIPVPSGDHVVGHLARQGNEIHSALFPKYRGKAASSVVRLYRRLLSKLFFLTTKVPLNDQAGITISERVGFREVRRDDQFIYFWMDETTILGAKRHHGQD